MLPRTTGPRRMSTNSTSANERNNDRRRVLKSGVIAYSGRHVTLRCAIRDLSESGARVLVEGSVAAPDTFELLCDTDGMEVPCQVVWRRGMEVGVRFMEPPRFIDRKRLQVVVQGKTSKPTLRRQPRVPA